MEKWVSTAFVIDDVPTYIPVKVDDAERGGERRVEVSRVVARHEDGTESDVM